MIMPIALIPALFTTETSELSISKPTICDSGVKIRKNSAIIGKILPPSSSFNKILLSNINSSKL